MSEQDSQRPKEGGLCWIEIPARDVEKLKEFYSALFPSWEFSPMTQNEHADVYPYRFSTPAGLGGGIVKMPADCPPFSQVLGSGYTNYYHVNDVDETTAKVEKLGGKLVLPKTKQGEMGLFVNVTDVEGNRFGLYQWLGHSAS